MTRTIICGTFLLLAPAAHAQDASVAVDVNGPHIVLRGSIQRDWNGVGVQLNDWWVFGVTQPTSGTSLCINAKAFTPDRTKRGTSNYDGVFFDPRTMKVLRVSAYGADRKPIVVRKITKGMIQPLTAAEAARCVGSAPPRKARDSKP